MDKPDICTINVREYGGTYIAERVTVTAQQPNSLTV